MPAQSHPSPAQPGPDAAERRPSSAGPSVDSEITWLLHRAAQRMRAATEEQAQKHVELAKTLGLDKTTLMTQLDRLERAGLVVRRSDPHDRRARIPEITTKGNALRAKVARACERVEAAALDGVSPEQVRLFRRMLFAIIGDTDDRGSCL